MLDRDQARHGVFLLPDPRTSAAVAAVTTGLRAQYGLVSAGRFPPHVTLAGSLALAVEETALLHAVETVAAAHRPVPVVNAGPRRLGRSLIAFDVHTDADGHPNEPLVDLAMDVTAAVRPLLGPSGDLPEDLPADLPPDLPGHAAWHAHLSLASHDLADRPDLVEEVEDFVRELAVPFPPTFVATRVAVYRQHRRDWSGRWWSDFTWEHLRSFVLGAGRAR